MMKLEVELFTITTFNIIFEKFWKLGILQHNFLHVVMQRDASNIGFLRIYDSSLSSNP